MRVSRFLKMCCTSFVLVMLFVWAGCVKLPPPDPSNPISKVAVLPLANNTNDMEGPNWVRVAFAEVIPARYYHVVSGDQVDQQLREKLNVGLGGQLDYTNPGVGAPSPQEVGKVLNVDGLFYCNLVDFQNIITGFYNKRKVKAKCKLVNAKTADVVWEKEEEASSSEMNLSVSGAIDSAKQKVVGSLVNKAFRANPLKQQTHQLVYQFQRTIPSGPVAPITTATKK